MSLYFPFIAVHLGNSLSAAPISNWKWKVWQIDAALAPQLLNFPKFSQSPLYTLIYFGYNREQLQEVTILFSGGVTIMEMDYTRKIQPQL